MTSPVHAQLTRIQAALRPDPAGPFRMRGAGPRTIVALGVLGGVFAVGGAAAFAEAIRHSASGHGGVASTFVLAGAAAYGAESFARSRRGRAVEARLVDLEIQARERAMRALLNASPVGAEAAARAAAAHAVSAARRAVSRGSGAVLDGLALPLMFAAAVAFGGVAAAPLALLTLALGALSMLPPAPSRFADAVRALERATSETLTRREALEAVGAAQRQGARIAALATLAAEAQHEEETSAAPRRALGRALAAAAVVGAIVWMAAVRADVADQGAFAAFILVAARFGAAALRLAEAAPETRAAWRTLRAAPPAEQGAQSIPAGPIRGVLAARGVVVRSGEQALLRGVSLDLRLGEIVAVCGPAEAGKSVLLEVLAGVRAPDAGSVTLDGRTFEAHNADSLRAAIGYLPQRAALFAGTVAENLRLFAPQASSEQMLEALAQAGLEGAGTLDVRVGPNEPLSPGFTAKVLLAGLYAKQPRLMILDDPGAMLDRDGDDAFKRRLEALRGETGVILVTNRPSHMRCCDRIIRLDHGMVRIDGPAKRVLSG